MSRDTTHILGRSMIGAGRGGSAMHAVAKGLAWLLYVVLAGQATAATITVTTTDDLPLTNIDPNTCSLREAIRAVLDTSPQDGCPAGSPDSADTPDTIDFALPLPGTISLSGRAADARRAQQQHR